MILALATCAALPVLVGSFARVRRARTAVLAASAAGMAPLAGRLGFHAAPLLELPSDRIQS